MINDKQAETEKSYFMEVFRDIKSICRDLHFKTIFILITTAVILILQYYIASRGFIRSVLQTMVPPAQIEIYESLIWCSMIFFLYFLIPFIIVKFVFKEKVSDYGLSLHGLKDHWMPYLTLFIIVLPAVVIAAGTPAFKTYYPFYGYVSKSIIALAIWELFYGIQFFGVEFFFRGFILFGLKDKLGFYSIFIMIVPYCMIHFGKPMGEAFGAILAGIILGYFALKSKSIFGGVGVHWLVAMTMDILAIYS